MLNRFKEIVHIIRAQYPDKEFIGLHEPVFIGNERTYVMDAIDSTFVSSVGAYVNKFEDMMCEITGSRYAVAVANGTSALHMALLVCGVKAGDEVISQALTFIATANAISYTGANPVFVDVDKDTLGMSPEALSFFLQQNAEIRDDGSCYNKLTAARITACVPMHTFGFPCRIDEIRAVCDKWNISLIEDAAESIGSYYKQQHTGIFGKVGIFSFNGNKTVTCGGGGALVTDDEGIAKLAKHLTTQAKTPHKWKFMHDMVGYNYRMPNLNAAIACAQLEQLKGFVENKRALAAYYDKSFKEIGVQFFTEPQNSKANYWLNVIVLENAEDRDEFLAYTNANNVMTRPTWDLMNTLPMFANAQTGDLSNSKQLADSIVNIPSGFRTNA